MEEFDWFELGQVSKAIGGNTVDEPASDFNVVEKMGHIVVQHDNEVRIPSSYTNDAYISHRVSDLRKAREILNRTAEQDHSMMAEVSLGVATTAIGAFLGALTSGLEPLSAWGILLFWIAPVVGVSFFVAFCFLRKQDDDVQRVTAARALEYLVDPDEGEGESDEYK